MNFHSQQSNKSVVCQFLVYNSKWFAFPTFSDLMNNNKVNEMIDIESVSIV